MASLRMEHTLGPRETVGYRPPVEPSWVPRGPYTMIVSYTCIKCQQTFTGEGSQAYVLALLTPCPSLLVLPDSPII